MAVEGVGISYGSHQTILTQDFGTNRVSAFHYCTQKSETKPPVHDL
jgi:hypothetical protein